MTTEFMLLRQGRGTAYWEVLGTFSDLADAKQAAGADADANGCPFMDAASLWTSHDNNPNKFWEGRFTRATADRRGFYEIIYIQGER